MKIINLHDTPTQSVIKQTVEVLQNGGLIIFPTETTYGAGVDATNIEAVNKLLSYKSRREGKPLSIAVTNRAMAEKYVEINDQAAKLYQQFLPGPVTVVSKAKTDPNGKTILPTGVVSEFGTLGVRIPDYQLVLDIVSQLQKPITATSANASGKKRPYQISDILDNLSDKQKNLIDLILDAGELPHNEPSVVIDTTLSAPVTLRGNVIPALSGDPQALQIDPGSESGMTLVSTNPDETKSIAGRLVLKNWDMVNEKGLVIALDGPLGAGKTILAKGVGEFLQIKDIIKSPTYTYICEYDFVRHQTKGKFFHLDLWKIDNQKELDRLMIDQLIKPNNVIVIEWWDQVKNFTKIKPDIYIKFIELTENERQLTIHESN